MDIRTTHVPGFKIGTAEDREGLTGVTVFWHLKMVPLPALT